MLRSDPGLADWSCYLSASGFARLAIFCAAFFFSAAIACGAPILLKVSLLDLRKMQTKNCRSHATASFPPPLLVSAHLAFYSPASSAVCSDHAPLAIPPLHNLSQELPSSQNANGQAKPPLLEHPFWDRENDLLFAAVGASRTLDYFSTLNFRRRGRNEALLTNDIVDNHAAFASIEAAATVASIGVSYLFHRYHHRRLERWTSMVHASLTTSGAVRNYCLKTVHP
ncbi:MAG TPA: hypothetical protein VM781_02210 [Candidatus Bathyarchaeia archaeon]|nr:hypothetical protein [Candidatus Bathyarchaeia archaeon]